MIRVPVSAHERFVLPAGSVVSRRYGQGRRPRPPRHPPASLPSGGAQPPWALQLVELGNAYGFSSGLLSLTIAPRGARSYEAVPLPVVVLIGVGLFAASFRRLRRPVGPLVQRAYTIARAAALGVMLVLLVLPLATIYAVLLSMTACGTFVALVYLPAIVDAARQVRSLSPPPSSPAHRLLLRIRRTWAHIAAAGLFLVSICGFYDPVTGFTQLVGFGEWFSEQALPALRAVPHAVEATPGYDGQFYAQLALDPLTRDPAIETAVDNFPYRARRILFACTAFVLGFGRPAWIVQAYAVQNVLCWLMLAVLLLRWLPPGSWRCFLGWFACLFGHGMLISVRYSLLEGPSVLLLVLAVLLVERERPWPAALVMGLSGLGRETNVLTAATLPGRWRGAGPLLRLVGQGLMVVMPFVLWWSYLRWSHPDVRGDFGSSGNFALPLAGYLGDWRWTIASLRADGWESFARFDVLGLISLTVQGVFVAAWRDWKDPWYRVGLAYAVLMLWLGPDVWAGSPGAVTRVLLPMTVAFNVLLARLQSRWRWPLLILGNLPVVHGLEVIRAPYVWTYL